MAEGTTYSPIEVPMELAVDSQEIPMEVAVNSEDVSMELDFRLETIAAKLGSKTIEENGTFSAEDDGFDGYSDVTVDVPASAVDTGTMTVSITSNGTTEEDVTGYASVEIDVNVPQGITPTGTKQINIAANGTRTEDVTNYASAQISVNVPASAVDSGTKNVSITSNGTTTEDVTGYASAKITVDVPSGAPNLQTKSVTPSESAQTVSADQGYDGLSQVNVGAVSSSYVGSGITRRSSSDLSLSGSTVTAPSGYYQSAGSLTLNTWQGGAY